MGLYLRRADGALPAVRSGDLPIEAGTCGRMVHAESLRCVHCNKRQWWLLNHALNEAEVILARVLEDAVS